MTDSVPQKPRRHFWGVTDAEAASRLRGFPAGEAPSAELGAALFHTLRFVDPRKVGAPVLESFVGYGDEHPALTVVRALFEDANSGEKPSHFDDPDFRASALALGQRLVQEYAPQPLQPQPEIGGPHGK